MIFKENLQKLDAGMLFIDTEHRISWMNKKAKEWFGHLEVGKKKKCYRTMEYSEDFCMICPTGRTINLGAPTHYELTLQRNGAPHTFEIFGVPIKKNGDITMVMEFILNRTDAEEGRVSKKELMGQIEKMATIGQLAAGIAHELNTPLGSISIITEELKSIITDRSLPRNIKTELQESLDNINTELNRCTAIIQEVLNFSRKEGATSEEVNINDLLAKAISLIQLHTIPKDISITMRLDNSIPKIKTDSERAKQVFFNILKNALDALIDRGSGKGKITITTGMEKQFAKATIADNGPGISVENSNKLFEPFFTTKPVGRGTGLGLFVSYGIMTELKGDIRIESKEGKGTTVSILFPMICKDEDPYCR